MFVRKKLRALLLAVLLVVAASHAAAITTRTTVNKETVKHTVTFTTADADDSVSKLMPACPVMSVRFYKNSMAQVTLYEVDPGDNTHAEIIADGNLLNLFSTTTTTPYDFEPAKMWVVFVLTEPETDGESVATVDCINSSTSAAGGGGVISPLEADLDLGGYDIIGDGSINLNPHATEGGSIVLSEGADETPDDDNTLTIKINDNPGLDAVSPVYEANTFGRFPSTMVGAWDVEVDIGATTTPCADINAAIAPSMESDVTSTRRVRVHHSGVESVSMVVETHYEDLGDYSSCIVLTPVTDTTGYPTTGTYRATSLSQDQKLVLFLDNLHVEVDQTAMAENAAFITLGGGWHAGHDGAGVTHGSLGQGVMVEGRVFGSVSTAVDNGYNTERLPSPGGTNPFNHNVVSAHTWLYANQMTYSYMGGLEVFAEGDNGTGDADDIMCVFVSTWGSVLPTCRELSDSHNDKGVGVLFMGAINAEVTGDVRHFGYGIVMGTPDQGGDVIFSPTCTDTCTALTQGTRGVNWTGGIVEGNKFANLVDISSDKRSTFRDVWWECDTGCQLAGFLMKPWFCDGTTGGVNKEEEDVPSVDDADTDCMTTGTGGVAEVATDSAGADWVDGDGVIVFSGRVGPNGDASQTESISPSIFLGPAFTEVTTYMFTDGIQLFQGKTAGDTSYFNWHRILGREANVAPRSNVGGHGHNISDLIGTIDTSGATWADPAGKLPTTYDNWVDSRLERMFWMWLKNPPSADTEFSTDVITVADKCVRMDDWPIVDTAINCSNSLARLRGSNGELYLTHAESFMADGVGGTESCQLGITKDGGSTHDVVLDMPPVAENWAGLEDYVYDISLLVNPDERWSIEIGDGVEGSPITSADCDGAYQVRWEFWGYPFAPFD